MPAPNYPLAIVPPSPVWLGGKNLRWVQDAKGGYSGTESWSADSSQVVSVYTIHWTELFNSNRNVVVAPRVGISDKTSRRPLTLPAYLLGYSFKTGADDIKRIIPMWHPVYPWMWATEISSVEGVGNPLPWHDAAGAAHNPWLNGPHKWRVRLPVKSNKGKSLFAAGSPFQLREYYKFTMRFQALPYFIAQDGSVVNEWDRYVVKEREASAVFVNYERDQMQYVTNTDNRPVAFKGSVGWKLLQIRHKWVWMQVPEYGLFAFYNSAGTKQTGENAHLSSYSIPTNLDAAVWKANAYTFIGKQPGTLLMEPPKLDCKVPPAPPWILNLGYYWPNRHYNVELAMVEFNPPENGKTTTYGHNFAPHPTNGLWYLVHSRVASLSASVKMKTTVGKFPNGTAGSPNTATVAFVAAISGLRSGSVITGTNIPDGTQVAEVRDMTSDEIAANAGYLYALELTKAYTGSNNTVQTCSFYPVPYELYDFRKVFAMV